MGEGRNNSNSNGGREGGEPGMKEGEEDKREGQGRGEERMLTTAVAPLCSELRGNLFFKSKVKSRPKKDSIPFTPEIIHPIVGISPPQLSFWCLGFLSFSFHVFLFFQKKEKNMARDLFFFFCKIPLRFFEIL